MSPCPVGPTFGTGSINSSWENEFTEKVLQLKKLRAEGGRWPVQAPGIEASRATVGRWIYAVDEKGRMSLAFSKDPEWVYQHGFLIPLRYESD